jgi:pimeloyl-ACP methyl ester carboxylesterase
MHNSRSRLLESPFALNADVIERALLSGEHGTLLERYFGETEYQELRQLALQAQRRAVRGGPRVYILPGIMGSKLGKGGLLFDDVLWFDPLEIAAGRLLDLSLEQDGGAIEPLGVVQLAYLRLKLILRIGGYDADYFPYDWRLDLMQLGRKLADRLAADAATEISLVAHSMGGLVSRAALAQGAQKVKRLIMLGTPNNGSFVPVQAFRGVYSVVRKVAALDLAHTAEELAEKVFSTFPGLCQMLPFAGTWNEMDLYDPHSWPEQGPRPRQQVLQQAPSSQSRLAPADERFLLIAGVNQETTTGLASSGAEFVYRQSLAGDGTVPLEFARLRGMQTWYVEEAHGSLPNNGSVADAVKDLLAQGTTDLLPDVWSPARGDLQRELKESELATEVFGGRRGDAVRESELRSLIEELAAPLVPAVASVSTPVERTTVVAGYGHQFAHVVVGRRRQHRLDIRLVHGSIDQVDARAYVLGMFRDVDPGGAAKAINAHLQGLITDFTTRRIFAANTGEVFLLPTGRHPIRCDMVLFAGMGPFDRYTSETSQLVAENVIRTFVRTRIDEFATVLMGSGSGETTAAALCNLLTGFIRGLQDADRDHHFRSITLCEMNAERYLAIKQELFRLASTSLFDDVEVTFEEISVPQPATPAPGMPRYLADVASPAYLIVREEADGADTLELRSSVLTAGSKATVVTSAVTVAKRKLDAFLRRIETRNFNFAGLDDYGEGLAALLLSEEIRAVLASMNGRRLVVVHDARSSRIPWETLRLHGHSPALEAGMSRRYMADNLSVAKWLEQRRHGDRIDLLLVVNPTGDLDGAEEEGERVGKLFGTQSRVRVTELRGDQASKKVLLKAFSSGSYDVVHYAGHAYFDAANPQRSGIVCAGGERLRGEELASLGNLPTLVFFNACEAARIRRASDDSVPDIKRRIQTSAGLAEAFLRGGVANYVGTYWPVGDDPALAFAECFYTSLLEGTAIGDALLQARKRVAALESVDWADYIHYGNPRFVLKGAD